MSEFNEPWKIGTAPPNGEQVIGTEQGLMLAVATTGANVDTLRNAERIVACINACEGIPTESIKDCHVNDYFIEQAFLRGFQSDTDSAGFEMNGIACQALAASFAGQFKGNGATNYLEIHLAHPETGDMVITIQRKSGKTPGQIAGELKEEVKRRVIGITCGINRIEL